MASQFIFAQSTTINSAPTSAEIGETITIEIAYDTGTADLATEVYYELRDVTGGGAVWKYSQLIALNTPASSGTHTTTTFTIPGTVDHSADYNLIVNYKIGAAWGSGNTQAIDITPGDSWVFGDNLEFLAGTTMDVPIKYTSDMDIAAGGIKFIFWTETRGTVSGTNLFSDIWFGAFTNSSVLPAGTDVETTITVNVPSGAINSSTSKCYLSSDLGPNWDPNAGDTGNNYVDHATTPAPTYTFQFRTAVGTDTNFTVHPGTSDFTVVETLSATNYEKLDATVFPNPTTGLLNISDVSDIDSISILSLTGQLVKTFNASNTIDISDLSSGIYILLTDTGKYLKVVKK